MAAKGQTERDRSRKTDTKTVDFGQGEGIGAMGAEGAYPATAVRSWTFEIVEATPAALRCHKGDTVIGSPSDQRIVVSHPTHGSIGFAPKKYAASILTALQTFPAAQLVGEVITSNLGRKVRAPTVRLNLIPD